MPVGQKRFLSLQNPIVIEVIKLAAGDANILEIAEINSTTTFATTEINQLGISSSLRPASLLHFPDVVSARGQVGKIEAAVSIGSCRSFSGIEDAVVVSVEENSHSRNTKFSGCLSAVAVSVVKFNPGDGTQRYDSGNRLCGKFRGVAGGVGCCRGD